MAIQHLAATEAALGARDVAFSELPSEIAASWQQSLDLGLRRHMPAPRPGGPPPANAFARRAQTCVETLGRDLDGTGIAVLGSDADARVVARYAGDDVMLRRLDTVGLAPGAQWSIETAGTSAIGLAASRRAAALVEGGEHFLAALALLTTASAPVCDIRTGRLLAVLTLVRAADIPNDLLLPVAQQSAHALEQQLSAVQANAIPRNERPPFGWDSLTEAELALAKLVAAGYTNRDAAARLFLSRHTVDAHLRHIFRKLDIKSRVELARIATANTFAAAVE